MMPSAFTLTIPGDPCISLNVYLRSHWRVRSRTKQAWIAQVMSAAIVYVADQQAQGATLYLHDLLANGKPRQVTLAYYFADHRRRDADNYLKIMLDALVRNGMLVDDSPEWCHAEAVIAVDKDNPRTEIRMVEV